MDAKANKAARTKSELLAENEELRARLDEAEQTLDAIRSGDVDALVVAGPEGDRVFSLTGAERTYRLIVETMNEAAVTVDVNGGILFCNQRFSDLMRCPLSEALGRKITDFVALAQKSPLQDFLTTAQTGSVQRSLTLRAADGGAVSVQLAASPLVDAGQTSICLVASDLTELEAQADSIRVMHEHQQELEESRTDLQVSNAALSQSRLAALNISEDAIAARRQAEELTAHLQREIAERKEAEAALKKSEALYRGIGESIDYGVWVCAPDGRNTYASESFLKKVGITQEQCSNFGWGDVLHPDDAERTIAAWQECVRTGGKWDIEHRFRGIDGQWHHVLARGVPIRDEEGVVISWAGINLDITDRKEAERARQLSEERYHTLFDNLLEGFCIIEMLFDADNRPIDYRFLSINPAFEEQTGLRNVEGKRIRELAPDNESYWYELYGKVALTGEPIRFENEAKALNRWYDVSAYRVGDEKDRKIAILFNDITESKLAEESLRESLREKEVLLKEIHHRVKNNMQVISSLVNLQSEALNNPELTGIFEDIRDRVRSMALVHEKLYSSDNLLTVDFAEYAAGLLNYLWRAHKNSADTITLTLDLKQVFLSVDFAIPCGLILNELAINTLKHAFKGRSNGEVAVTLSSDPDAIVCMTVSDNGVGMPDGLDWRQSNSLGLNLVQILSKQLKARVEVRSNNGTEFRITFNTRYVKGQQDRTS